MAETVVDLKQVEEMVAKKLESKDSEIKVLKDQIDQFNKSVAKAELNKRDEEIVNLNKLIEDLNRSVASFKTLAEEKDSALKNTELKVKELTESLKVKSDEFDGVNKELTTIKNEATVINRIKTYRDKSGDTVITDEDLKKDFALMTDEAFTSAMKYVKKIDKVDEKTVAEQAKAAIDNAVKSDEKVIAPTETAKSSVDPLRSAAKGLISTLIGRVKKE